MLGRCGPISNSPGYPSLDPALGRSAGPAQCGNRGGPRSVLASSKVAGKPTVSGWWLTGHPTKNRVVFLAWPRFSFVLDGWYIVIFSALVKPSTMDLEILLSFIGFSQPADSPSRFGTKARRFGTIQPAESGPDAAVHCKASFWRSQRDPGSVKFCGLDFVG